jgi:hypothetical protein
MRKLMLSTITTALFLISATATAGDYKAQLHNSANNVFAGDLKIYWYCDGRKKDKDTVAYLKKKTRKLSSSRCGTNDELTIKVKAGKIPLQIKYRNNAEFGNEFVGNNGFVFTNTKHCFNIGHQLVSGQPMIQEIRC